MADPQAAKRYAQAAFQIALANGTIDQWSDGLKDVATVLSESTIAPLLADRKVPVEHRQAMLDRALDISPLVLNLARLLVVKGRSMEAAAVSKQFDEMADEQRGIAHASVTTAVELTPEQLKAIEDRLSTQLGKQVQATATVDPAILGGVVVKVGDKLVDGSVRSRLKRLRRELEGVR